MASRLPLSGYEARKVTLRIEEKSHGQRTILSPSGRIQSECLTEPRAALDSSIGELPDRYRAVIVLERHVGLGCEYNRT